MTNPASTIVSGKKCFWLGEVATVILLRFAGYYCEMGLLHLLLSHGANPKIKIPLKVRSSAGWEPHPLLVNYMLTKLPLDLDDEMSLLDLAVLTRQREAIWILVHAGLDVHAHSRKGMTALHWAAIAGDLDGMQVLLDLGADPLCRNAQGLTPGQFARMQGFQSVQRFLP